LGTRRLDPGDHSAVGGVLDIERLARRRIDPFAPDELLIRLDALKDVSHVRNPPEDSAVAGDCPAIVLRRKEPSRRAGRTVPTRPERARRSEPRVRSSRRRGPYLART